jgi:hypothetical protein
MRYQERIYIQNENGGVRNRDILNVNMSSDICVFENPLYNLSGASKLDCTGYTGTTYVISTATTIPLTFQFTANTNSFSANSASFSYEIYKYDTDAGAFFIPPVYTSGVIEYSGFSATSSIYQAIPVSGLSMDGEYLVKGYFDYTVCTEYMSRLGKKIDTLLYRTGTEYGLYDGNEDYFFRAITEAAEPIFQPIAGNVITAAGLKQVVILPEEGITDVVIPTTIIGAMVLTLNGLILADGYDYSVSGGVITLSSSTVYDDIITIICNTEGSSRTIVSENIIISSAISSGTTGNEGSNMAYFNTTTGKYEIYTQVTPSPNDDVLVMLNGATLAINVDYYPSITNPKRMILEGDLQIGDILTLIYYAKTNIVGGIYVNYPTVGWGVTPIPELANGVFSLEVSTGNTFTSFYYTGTTPYVAGQDFYTDGFTASGTIGTTLYYRVKNTKNYETICGDIVTSTAYSEIIPIVVQSNAINSY